ncbi:hypothetical protein GQ473_04535, partial [archaeon]|nr:hypothetical protein [archaeon]
MKQKYIVLGIILLFIQIIILIGAENSYSEAYLDTPIINPEPQNISSDEKLTDEQRIQIQDIINKKKNRYLNSSNIRFSSNYAL